MGKWPKAAECVEDQADIERLRGDMQKATAPSNVQDEDSIRALKVIRCFRKSMGITQNEMALSLGISLPTFGRTEAGLRVGRTQIVLGVRTQVKMSLGNLKKAYPDQGRLIDKISKEIEAGGNEMFWSEKFMAYLNTLDPDTLLTVVDIHI